MDESQLCFSPQSALSFVLQPTLYNLISVLWIPFHSDSFLNSFMTSCVQLFFSYQGKQRDIKYPQPEGTLGECMQKHGEELGSESRFGKPHAHMADRMGIVVLKPISLCRSTQNSYILFYIHV